mgnify:CR=1 FL=1
MGTEAEYYEIDWYWPSGEDDNFYGELAMKEELRISSTIHAKTKTVFKNLLFNIIYLPIFTYIYI